MTMNPKMKVLVQQGYYDLACPYGAVQHAIEHLNITPEVREKYRDRVLRSRAHDVRAPGVDGEVREDHERVH